MMITLTPLHSFLLPPSCSISFKSLNPNLNPRKHHLQTLYGFNQFKSHTQLSHLPNASQTSHSDSGLLFRKESLNLESHLNTGFRLEPFSKLRSIKHFLSSMGIERSAVDRIFDMHPQLLTYGLTDLRPIFDFLLYEVNIPHPSIRKTILRCPRLLVSSLNDQLRPTLDYLRKLGFVGRHSLTSRTITLLVNSVEDMLMPRMDSLQTLLGFSYSEVVSMVPKSPGLLTFSIENDLCPKMKYFVEEMKGDLVELKNFPQYFTFSLEKKIKPRHRLLVKHSISLPLWLILKLNDREFNDCLINILEDQEVDEDIGSSSYSAHVEGGQ